MRPEQRRTTYRLLDGTELIETVTVTPVTVPDTVAALLAQIDGRRWAEANPERAASLSAPGRALLSSEQDVKREGPR